MEQTEETANFWGLLYLSRNIERSGMFELVISMEYFDFIVRNWFG